MTDSELPTTTKTSKWYAVLLVGLPLWLVVSAIGALWYYFHLEKREAETRQAAFAREISIVSLADDLRKFTNLIGERHTGEGDPAMNLSRAASMIEGVLGPSNTGLEITRHRGPTDWPLLETAISAGRSGASSVWVITSYDAPLETLGGQFNASGLSAIIATIQAAANDKPERHLRFLFLPHLYDAEAPVAETLRLAAERITARGEADAVLWIEAMGADSELLLSANQAEALPVDHLTDLGSVISGPHGLVPHERIPPWFLDAVVRVSTREAHAPGEPDNSVPSPTFTADAAGKLLELIRRIANRVE